MRATKNVVNLKIRTGTNLAKFSEIKLLGTPGTPGTPGTVGLVGPELYLGGPSSYQVY